MQLPNSSWIRAMSMVAPALTAACLPSAVTKAFSGEKDGQVVSFPSLSGISQSRQNSAAPFIIG